ncbi:hypothetical protein [Chlorogloea sp. CCALA 695]|uniref:hypothetical protein n=1 Tax=Chlorogloea sp. CCALA 695 TaxID=2107693 RepID=UPI000D06BE77|nr:hypothetical protein [Chlorogloea sp. CCALA 695]PSB32282.1 hypothetical protein C7B70_11000 [Chlorogloea sp. CCALA 695]
MKAKSSVYPAVMIASLFGLVVLVLGAMQFSVSIEQPPTVLPDLSPVPSATPTGKKQGATIAKVAGVPGALILSNQTDLPVRVALLARGKKAVEPAHWDFAPLEGSTEGLVLSLPEGNFKLEKGDVLVAFAQDGSGQYWGPYVVGESDAPTWDAKLLRWNLTLQ